MHTILTAKKGVSNDNFGGPFYHKEKVRSKQKEKISLAAPLKRNKAVTNESFQFTAVTLTV
jgi:hypothetical protein